MDQKFIIDEEINLKTGYDFLNTRVYADTLQEVLKSAPEHKAFTVGLFGEWGSGKSSILKTAREHLENENPKTKFITFDAWKYGDDAFRRSFILSMQKILNIELDKAEYNLYENVTQHIEKLKIKLPKNFILFTAGILIILISLFFIFPTFQASLLRLVTIVFITTTSCTAFVFIKKVLDKDLFGKLLSYLNALIHTKYDIEKPLMFSPEQFAKAFETIIDKASKIRSKIVNK